jgi:iron complex outermembrane receptor protein
MLHKVAGFDRDIAVRRWLRASVSPLGLIALLSWAGAGSAHAQAVAQAGGKTQQQLDQINVTEPRRKPPARRATTPSTQGGRVRAPRQTPVPTAAPAPTADQQRHANETPLNTNVVAGSASRLGLTPREVPATVEVIDQQTLKDRGLRTTTEAVEAATGVTAGSAPGAPSILSMRGFVGDQINTLYNGIKVGPSSMTSRPMDTGNLEQIEILKGPASLLSGEGATGGAINYVTKKPHTGKVENEAFTSYDSISGFRSGFGSGGSSVVKGLDYRFDVVGAQGKSFIDDTYSKLLNISGQLDYRVRSDFKVWGAIERKQDKDRFYWGTPLVPANAPGIVPTSGVVSGLWTNYYLNGHTGTLNPVTVDARTLRTTYNVLDNKSGATELWLRGGFDYDITNNIKLKSQVYQFNAKRDWFNNEINAFDDSGPNNIYRERLQTHHKQSLTGNITDLVVDNNIFGMENRFSTTFAASTLDFNVRQGVDFPSDTVELVNPVRGLYGDERLENFYTRVDNQSLSFEDRLKITKSFALIGGIRVENIELHRSRVNADGFLRTDAGYPMSTTFRPVTGRIGYTWEAIKGLTFYSQYATAADPTVANIFIIRPTSPLLLTTSRTYETGVKQVFWDNRAEWILSAYDIERRNVYVPESALLFNIAGKIKTRGVELAGAVNPFGGLKLWGNVAFVQSRFVNFDYIDDFGVAQSYSGMTPANVPRFVANAGGAYRFMTPWPVELGVSGRHVGNRFNFQDNLVTMNAYTVGDAYVFVDIPKSVFQSINQTRLSFRVRNFTNKLYASWGDPSYNDQIILGAPRSYEVAASFKW